MTMSRLVLITLLCSLPGFVSAAWPDWWRTSDQQAAKLTEEGQWLKAAELFEDPMQKGVAYFRGGDFESAESVFGRIQSPEAAYNRGNALVMLGRYEEAIASYGRALDMRPDWQEARKNQTIAIARRDKLAPPESDAGGTGGELGADEIVFDDSGRVSEGGSEVEATGGESMAEDDMRAVWLRRVQNDPREFLATRFAYQLYRKESEQAEDGDEAGSD